MVGLRACPFAAGRLAALSGQVDKAVQVWPGAKVACRAGGPVLSTTFCPPLDWTIFFWLDWIPVLSGQIQALDVSRCLCTSVGVEWNDLDIEKTN